MGVVHTPIYARGLDLKMAFFSQNLFEVFEEKSEPVSLTGKRRRRIDAPDEEKERGDDQKKARVRDSSPAVVVEEISSKSTPSDVVDLTADDEVQAKDDTT